MSLILSGTDGLSDVDGSAATPAIRGTDANTGIFFPAADTIGFAEGGVEAMRLNSAGNLQTLGTISVGNATPSTSGAGITFPATQSASTDANTLDDYEEGTWTPSFALLSGSLTYSSQTGNYVKIGRQVTVTFSLTVATSSSAISDGGYIAGLPFIGVNVNFAGVAFAFTGTSGLFYNFSNILGLLSTATSIQLRGSNTANIAPGLNFGGATVTANSSLAGTLTYFTS